MPPPGSVRRRPRPPVLRSVHASVLAGLLASVLLAGCGSGTTTAAGDHGPSSDRPNGRSTGALVDPVRRFATRCVHAVGRPTSTTPPGTHLCLGSTARVPIDDTLWGVGLIDVTVRSLDRVRVGELDPSALDADAGDLTGAAVLRVDVTVVGHRATDAPGPGLDVFHGGGLDVATDGVHTALPSDSVGGCATAYLPQEAGPGDEVSGCTVVGLRDGATALGGAFADLADYLVPADQVIWS